MALAVCLLFDARTDQALRTLWRRIEELGVQSLHSHTHGRHVPHLSYAVVQGDADRIVDAVTLLPDEGPCSLHFDALGMFRRSRPWLVPGLARDMAARQGRVVEAVESTGAELHAHYRPGVWVPHCTLAPRTRLEDLPSVAAAVYEVLPLVATVDAAALVDSSTGEIWPLPLIP